MKIYGWMLGGVSEQHVKDIRHNHNAARKKTGHNRSDYHPIPPSLPRPRFVQHLEGKTNRGRFCRVEKLRTALCCSHTHSCRPVLGRNADTLTCKSVTCHTSSEGFRQVTTITCNHIHSKSESVCSPKHSPSRSRLCMGQQRVSLRCEPAKPTGRKDVTREHSFREARHIKQADSSKTNHCECQGCSS